MARSAGVDPEKVVLALIERGVDVDDPERPIEGATRKIARAIIKEIRGGPVVVRAHPQNGSDPDVLEPAARSSDLIAMLSVEDVEFIHERLCDDFATTPDPIDPPGIRDASLLESAVGRQHSGYAQLLKYPEPILNAATLLYGICNDHPFHNGNKRTALVSGLAHLDKNNRLLRARQTELFNLMIAVADHAILRRTVKVGRSTESVTRRGTPDEEVKAIADWLRSRIDPITRGEKPITYRELRQILANFSLTLTMRNNGKMDVCRSETRRILRLKAGQHSKTLMVIRWPGDGRTVPIKEIKHIRQTLKLCEGDGVTSDTFYAKGVRVDRFINDYRVVLRKLASR
jgi:death-on-curing protein